MVPIFIFWVLTNIGCLGNWDMSISKEFDLLETWGINRIKREADPNIGREKILSKFSRRGPAKSCRDVGKTKETPFVAVILFRTSGRLMCMGSIVDNLHILSAKRCYDRVDPNDLKVLVGCFKAYWAKDSQVADVRKILRHEHFLAVLRLRSPIRFTDYVKPVRLPPFATSTITDFSTIFWGPYKIPGFKVDRYDVPGEFAGQDKMYELLEDDLAEFDACKANFSKLVVEDSKLFCTTGNATFCWGAMGSAVLRWMPVKAIYLLVGVVVYDNCTTFTTGPKLAARADAYANWIQGNVYHSHQPL